MLEKSPLAMALMSMPVLAGWAWSDEAVLDVGKSYQDRLLTSSSCPEIPKASADFT